MTIDFINDGTPKSGIPQSRFLSRHAPNRSVVACKMSLAGLPFDGQWELDSLGLKLYQDYVQRPGPRLD